MSVLWLRLVCVVFVAQYCVGNIWGQAPPAGPTTTIQCRIVGDIGHRPVPRARLTLSGGRLGEPLVVYTNESGRAVFEGVPAGRYDLSVEKAAYFPLTGAKLIPVIADTPPRVELGDIVLVTVRSVSGSVRWKGGDPADRIIVHALLVKRGVAEFRPGDARLTMTNDRGEYRIEGLAPGRYVVYCYTQGMAQAGSKPRIALPVFYPDSSLPSVANAIDLRQTAEASEVTMTLEETTGVKVSGVIGPAPNLAEGASVLVGLHVTGSPAQPIAGTKTKIGVPFDFLGIPPGSYTVIVVAEQRPNMRTFYPLAVGTSPITDTKIPFVESRSLVGEVEFQARTPEASTQDSSTASVSSCPKVRFLAQSDKFSLFSALFGATGDNCEFYLDGAALGETYKLTIFQGPPDVYVAKVTQAQQELSGAPFPVVEGGGRIHVVLKNDVSVVNGRLTNAQNRPVTGFVVLVPKDHTREHLFRTGVADTNGSFRLTAVPPGEYRAFAFEKNEEDSYLDEEYLRKFSRRAVPVSVEPRSEHNITLELP